MHIAAISRGLCLGLLAAVAAQAQTIAAGARAVVNSDTLPVYATMSETAEVKVTLAKGEAVIIGLVLFGSDITWCAISRVGQTKRLGFASCEFLEPDRGPTAPDATAAPQPAPTAPAPAPSKPKPIKIREVPQAPVTVREVPSAPQPVPVAAVEPPPTGAPVSEPAAAPTVPAPPAPAAMSQRDFVETLLDDSGLRASVANYTRSTNLLSFLDKSRLAELELPTLERVLAHRFEPSAFYNSIDSQVRRNYAPEHLPDVVAWLRSPVTTKLAALERQAFSPGAREELMAFASGMGASPPPQPRLVLIHRLFESLRTCDMEVEATIALVHTVAQAIGPVLPQEKRYGANELDRALGGVKARYRAIMKNARIVHYLFAYQHASDEELEQYVNFLESASGKWLISLVDKGFYDATETIARGLRADIPRNVKAKRRLPTENTANGLLP